MIRRILSLTALLISAIAVSVSAGAEVNAANGSYYHRLKFPKADDAAMPIMAMYDHQRKQVGLFGAGWCSELEHRLSFSVPNELSFHQCGGGRRIDFKKNGKQYELKGLTAKFPAINQGFDGGYTLTLSPLEQLKFDDKGQVVSVIKGKRSMKIARNIKTWLIFDEFGKEVAQVGVSEQKAAVSLKTGNESYQFTRGGDRLVKVTGPAETDVITFAYDDAGRMREVAVNGKAETIEYDNKRDTVSQLSWGDCAETLSYKVESDDKFKLETELKCGKKTTTGSYSFRKEKGKFFQEQFAAGKPLFRKVVNSATGRPIMVETGKGLHQEFDVNGALRVDAKPGQLENFKLDDQGRLSKIDRHDRMGNTITELTYEKKSNRISAIQVDREKVAVGYAKGKLDNFSYRDVVAQNGKTGWSYVIGGKTYKPGETKVSFLQAASVLTVQDAIKAYQRSEKVQRY